MNMLMASTVTVGLSSDHQKTPLSLGFFVVEISHHILIDSPEMAWEVCQFQCRTYAIVFCFHAIDGSFIQILLLDFL